MARSPEGLRACGRRIKQMQPADNMVFDLRDPEGNRVQVYRP